MSVKDRVAIVTGAGGGLGREYALLLASKGAKVVVNDYGGSLDGKAGTIARAQTVVDEITAAGGQAIADGHDVSVKADAKAIAQLALDTWGRIDILVNNAGITGRTSPIDDLDVDAFMRVLEIGTLGAHLMTSAVWKAMAAQKHGRIVYIASDGILGFGAGGDCAYAASKGANYALVRDLGRYSPQFGIKINALFPSASTRMTELSEGAKFITDTYFAASTCAPVVAALVSDECPVSGEGFTAGANRSARMTMATFPGHTNETTAEGYLANWDTIWGKTEDAYVPTGTLDHVRYGVLNATGQELKVEDIPGLGVLSKD